MIKRLKQFKPMLFTLASTVLISGCALAPGMYAGGLDTGIHVVAKDPKTGRGQLVHVYEMTPDLVTQLNQQHPPKSAPQSHPFVGYFLGPGDVVSITVWDHPELTIPQGEFRSPELTGNLIDSDGSLFYPYCGRIQAAGLNRATLRNNLVKCLSRVIRNPQVDVRIIQYRSQHISIGGAVKQPGRVNLTDIPLYLADAIHAAGGSTTAADPRYVTLSRGPEQYVLDFQAYTENGNDTSNPLLRHGDVIHVASQQERRINVLGEVLRPKNIQLHTGVQSLSDALAEVNGLNPQSAESNRILVMREMPEGDPAVYWLRGDDPMQLLLASNLQLQGGDVVYVDQTGLSRWGRVIGQILPAFSLLNQGSSAATR